MTTLSTLAAVLRATANGCDMLRSVRAEGRADAYRDAADRLDALAREKGWRPIAEAPHDRSVLLATSYAGGTHTPGPMYCGRLRYGTMGEPQTSVRAWRCDSSGRFADPTHFRDLPPPPTGDA